MSEEALKDHIRNLFADPQTADLHDIIVAEDGSVLLMIEAMYDPISGRPGYIGRFLDFLPPRTLEIIRERYEQEAGEYPSFCECHDGCDEDCDCSCHDNDPEEGDV